MTDLVLVIGSGGREHALAWKLSQSEKIQHVYVAPGNAGTTEGKMSNLDINVKNHAVISDWCKKENISLVVVGPEDPLANGLADHLNSVGIKCFGPCQRAAEIEASKKFAKDFMDKYSIPTARWKSFQSADEAKAHISSASYEALVVKASGLAAGKGVIVGKDRADAIKAVNSLKEEKSLSSASETIVIEELLSGEEVSVLCFTDGTHISVMPPAQDHKRLLENDEGPNTGGMGAYCKCPLVSSDDMKFIAENVLQRAVDGMVAEKSPYVGVLYAGLMMTKDGIKVLEFNCRFGDPETQVIVPLLKTDLYDVMLACVDGTLDKINLEWNSDKHAVGVVVVSGGYPGSYGKGKVIKNIDKVERLNHIVFHAGTANKDGSVVTSGGRVLAVVALENSLQKAADEARLGASLIQFDGSFFRQDIAKKGVQKLQPSGLTYKSAGVDIDSADDLVGKISALTKQTRRPELRSGIGGFAGIFELSNFDDPFLVSKVGTIGEKLQAAQDCGKFEVAGHDLVAHSVNDILSCGAEPLFFLDTFTCGKLNVDIAAQVITGIAKACKLANCSLIGGETAEMPGMYDDTDFDLTGFARGAVERSQLLPQKTTISSGDIAIGLLSLTVNSNGFKVVKKVMDRLGYSYKTPAPFGKKLSFEDILLQPRNIYVDSVLPLLKKGVVKAAAYMSDQGLSEKVQKVLPDGFKLVLNAEELKIPPMYHWVHEQANLSSSDMLSYFNFGIDMILVVDKTKAEEVLEHLKSKAVAASIGAVQKREKGQNVVDIVNARISCIQKPKKRVAVLSSNKGTCVDALIEYTLNPSNLSNAAIALVVTSETGSNLAKAKEAKIPIKMVNSSQDLSLLDMLKSYEIEVICLDSFTLKLSSDILKVWNGRILNSHPSLLPAFECENVHQEVINFGARITGCTVYLEEGEPLSGKILEQTALNVEVGESAETLREKLQNLQNLIYIKALESVVSGTSHESCIHSESSQIYLRNLEKKIHTIMETTARPGFERVQDSPCDFFDLKKSSYIHPYLLSGTDGVGTKLKIAMALNKHDTIGIDLVAMCVNDILTHGAEPLFFLECFSTGKVNEKAVLSVVSGIAEGCKQANCALIGTDINEMPDIYMNSKKPLQELNTYDVVGYAEGAMQKEHLLPRLSDIKADDVVIGLASSGVHSNGYSLVRKLIQVKNFRYQDPFPLDKTKTIGEVLLTPTKIYVQSMMPLIKKGLIKAAAHITGGGLTQNIPRVLPPHVKVVLDGTKWQMPPVLKWIAMEAQMSEEEILKTFNCGLGMVLVVDKQNEAEALRLLKSKGETAATIGRIQPLVGGGEQVQVENFKVPLPVTIRKKKRVGVLISGSGTNLQSLIDYTQNPSNCSNAEIVLVLSNVAGVEGLKRAERANIPTKVLSHKDFKKRVDFDMAVHALLQESKVDIVCLAGFMRIVSKEFVQLWQGKLLNVHPAILPAFKGMNAHKLVLERGAKISGCTVHFVEAEVDAGAVIEQAAVRVDPDDDEKSLQEKVKVMEHKIFPTALELLASGRVSRGSNGKLVWN